jgi:hypothetical protein
LLDERTVARDAERQREESGLLQAESSGTKVLAGSPALRSRMVAKLQEQMNKDRDMKDGDTYQAPKTPHALTGTGTGIDKTPGADTTNFS